MINETQAIKKKGFWLTSVLILMFIGNAFTALSYFGNSAAIMQTYPMMSKALISFMGLLALVNIALIIALWHWRKVGVIGICLCHQPLYRYWFGRCLNGVNWRRGFIFNH
jgi:hypothetical protein